MSLSDPLRPPGKTPRRADPIQPDRPGSSDSTGPAPDDEGRAPDRQEPSASRQAEQSKAAIDNVSKGYD